jgi:hypothetical protein
MKQTLLLVAFFLNLSVAYTQNFMYESNKFSVKENGYHKIELNEQIINHLTSSLGNIKLYDQNNQEVKHYLQASPPINSSIQRHTLPFYRTKKNTGINTEIIVENSKKETIDYFVLHCKAFSTTKKISISGSYDHEQWITLVENYKIVYQANMPIDVSIAERSEFRFYKIVIDDFDTEPITIDKIFAETSLFPKESYVNLEIPKMEQKTVKENADSICYVDFNFSECQYINWLDFHFVANTANYALNVELQAKKDSLAFFEHIQSFQLANGKPNYLVLNKLYGQFFRLKIHYYNQQRIKFSAIEAQQLKYHLIANLETTKVYQLRFGGEHQNMTSSNILNFQIADTLEIIYPNNFSVIRSTNLANQFIDEDSAISLLTWLSILSIILVIAIIVWIIRKKTSISKHKLSS